MTASWENASWQLVVAFINIHMHITLFVGTHDGYKYLLLTTALILNIAILHDVSKIVQERQTCKYVYFKTTVLLVPNILLNTLILTAIYIFQVMWLVMSEERNYYFDRNMWNHFLVIGNSLSLYIILHLLQYRLMCQTFYLMTVNKLI